MSPEASKFLEYLDAAIADQKAVILRGAVGGASIEQVAVNYKASTMQLRNFERIREQFDEIFNKKQAAEDEGDSLQTMPEEDET